MLAGLTATAYYYTFGGGGGVWGEAVAQKDVDTQQWSYYIL